MAQDTRPALQRLGLLVGPRALARLASTRVVLFGIGGVGSWCAEALVRSGVGHLTVVDFDTVHASNLNRQLQATSQNLGNAKVLELQTRLEAIRPSAVIEARQETYCADTAGSFELTSYDYVIDAIDMLSHKVELLANCITAGVTVFSSFGASCKLDPTQIRIGSVWSTEGCPLGKFVRKRLRKRLRLNGLEGDFLCVYSREQSGGSEPLEDVETGHKQRNGSAVHVTGSFGFALAGLVLQDVVRKQRDEGRNTT